jgi:hypothetical protein
MGCGRWQVNRSALQNAHHDSTLKPEICILRFRHIRRGDRMMLTKRPGKEWRLFAQCRVTFMDKNPCDRTCEASEASPADALNHPDLS